MFSCRICNNNSGNTSHYPKEMMFGTGEVFEYIECSSCGILQIKEIPSNISDFYPENYYSYSRFNIKNDNFIVKSVRKVRSDHQFKRKSLLGSILVSMFGKPDLYNWLSYADIKRSDTVLDVGCGAGKLLLFMEKEGFKNLTGIDPFIVEDIEYSNGVKINKKFLKDFEGEFDFIMLHYSFEHMTDPLAVLKELYRLLKPGKSILLRIPVIPCYAWEHYGINWFNLDAPRHFNIFSKKSMAIMADKAGFEISNIICDSREVQFWGSELYSRGLSFMESVTEGMSPKENLFSKKEMLDFKKRTLELDKNNYGDLASFYLYKK